MVYLIIILLIIASSVVMYKIGYNVGKTHALKYILDSIDSEKIKQGQLAVVFMELMNTIIYIANNPIKIDRHKQQERS